MVQVKRTLHRTSPLAFSKCITVNKLSTLKVISVEVPDVPITCTLCITSVLQLQNHSTKGMEQLFPETVKQEISLQSRKEITEGQLGVEKMKK